MQYHDLVRDFAKRTQANLEFVAVAQQRGDSVYEVTQLVNSMLGLLIFPQQQYVDAIPETPLSELAAQGWPIPRVVGTYTQVKDLKELVRYLRNAISHCNVEFQSQDEHIVGLELWNIPPGKPCNWRAALSTDELKGLTEKFLELLLK